MGCKLLQISVSLPKDYAGFTSPILKAHFPPSSKKVNTILLVDWKGNQVSLMHPPAFLTWLSHPHWAGKQQHLWSHYHFPTEIFVWSCWLQLLGKSHTYVISKIGLSMLLILSLGHELLWMSFIAACPTFLQGPWPYWHPRILVEGKFIQDWLNRAETNGENLKFEDVSVLHKDLWEQFHQVVMSLAHLYSHIPIYFCFSITFITLLIHHHAPCHHDLMQEPPCSLVHDTHLYFIGLASLSWWTSDGYNSHVYIFFLSYLTCPLTNHCAAWSGTYYSFTLDEPCIRKTWRLWQRHI